VSCDCTLANELKELDADHHGFGYGERTHDVTAIYGPKGHLDVDGMSLANLHQAVLYTIVIIICTIHTENEIVEILI
jgi:hypothetical protein